MDTILGQDFWHGYLKLDFLDPWDGANLESYMAIDFIELAVDRDSLGGFGVNPEDRRFEEIRQLQWKNSPQGPPAPPHLDPCAPGST